MQMLRFALLVTIAVVLSVGCEQPGVNSFSVTNTGPYPVELQMMVPNPDPQMVVEPQGARTLCPALPVRLASASICLGPQGYLEVSNDGPEPVHVSYLDNTGEPRTLLLDQDHVGYFDAIPTITIGSTQFDIRG